MLSPLEWFSIVNQTQLILLKWTHQVWFDGYNSKNAYIEKTQLLLYYNYNYTSIHRNPTPNQIYNPVT